MKSISFIFDVTKKTNPILYVGFYAMQFMFWQTVVAGGLLADMKLSARLLLNSLVPIGKEPKDLIIEDDETIKLITESEVFKEKIKQLIEKYGKENDKFVINDYKNEDNSWKFEIEINDTYDFTDFKNLKEYVDAGSDKMLKDIFSTLLNNFGVVSSEYGVIKIFEVKIKSDYTAK